MAFRRPIFVPSNSLFPRGGWIILVRKTWVG